MKIVIPIITAFVVACITAGLILFTVNRKVAPLSRNATLKELTISANTVSRRIENLSEQLVSQVSGFCSTVAEDRDFAMKLIVEQDYSASEVADIAGRFMLAMGFDFLEVTDAKYRILSSGHFPASAGNSAAQKSSLPDSVATFLEDDIKGAGVLSLQVKIPFSCADIALYAFGGIFVDANFIAGLKPHDGVRILLKQGNEIAGMDDIETMSEIKDNTIIINDKTWLASSLTLSWAGEGNGPEIILLMEEPADFSLLDLI